MTKRASHAVPPPETPGAARVRVVRVSPTMAYEFQTRDVHEFAWQPGRLRLTAEQFDAMLDDVAFYADPNANDMEPSRRRAYAALASQLLKTRSGVPDLPSRMGRPPST